MTREEATAEAARLTREHPDRATHSWLARESAGGAWAVARVGLPSRGSTVNTQESKPRPPQADDPRPVFWRDVGGPYGACRSTVDFVRLSRTKSTLELVFSP